MSLMPAQPHASLPHPAAPRCAPACAEREWPAVPDLHRHLTLGLASILTAAALTVQPAAAELTKPFLESTGATGGLALSEKRLLDLRQQTEGKARADLEAERRDLEAAVKEELINGNQLCATPFGVDVVGITQSVGLVGALVGGVAAKARKDEVEALNEQLRAINVSLRQQARAGTLYAPGLTYVPPASRQPPPGALEQPVKPPASPEGGAAPEGAAAPPMGPPSPALTSFSSMDETEMSPLQSDLTQSLKQGRSLLKDGNGSGAMVRFEKALVLARRAGNLCLERRALRGIAAAARINGQLHSAVDNLKKVLAVSQRMDDYTGDADAYGTIADLYTDIGEFEKAAVYYDRYIDRMQSDSGVV